MRPWKHMQRGHSSTPSKHPPCNAAFPDCGSCHVACQDAFETFARTCPAPEATAGSCAPRRPQSKLGARRCRVLPTTTASGAMGSTLHARPEVCTASARVVLHERVQNEYTVYCCRNGLPPPPPPSSPPAAPPPPGTPSCATTRASTRSTVAARMAEHSARRLYASTALIARTAACASSRLPRRRLILRSRRFRACLRQHLPILLHHLVSTPWTASRHVILHDDHNCRRRGRRSHFPARSHIHHHSRTRAGSGRHRGLVLTVLGRNVDSADSSNSRIGGSDVARRLRRARCNRAPRTSSRARAARLAGEILTPTDRGTAIAAVRAMRARERGDVQPRDSLGAAYTPGARTLQSIPRATARGSARRERLRSQRRAGKREPRAPVKSSFLSSRNVHGRNQKGYHSSTFQPHSIHIRFSYE